MCQGVSSLPSQTLTARPPFHSLCLSHFQRLSLSLSLSIFLSLDVYIQKGYANTNGYTYNLWTPSLTVTEYQLLDSLIVSHSDQNPRAYLNIYPYIYIYFKLSSIRRRYLVEKKIGLKLDSREIIFLLRIVCRDQYRLHFEHVPFGKV